MLGALGAWAGGEAAHLRELFITALVEALKTPGSRQEVIIADKSHGPREEALLTALLQVTG